jgi:phytoene synthase
VAEPRELPQPLSLLIAHARAADRDWHRLCWSLDERMARIVLGAREGSVAAIRLAWWEEALTVEGKLVKGEPMLEQWHAARPTVEEKAQAAAVAGAWRMLLDPAPMSEGEWQGFGQGRGALFPLIARGGEVEALTRAGALWALWDVARNDADRQRAEGAFAAAIAVGQDGTVPQRPSPKPLRLATAMALDDVRERTLPEPRFTPRQYLRMVGRALLG